MGVRLPGGWQRRLGWLRHGHHSRHGCIPSPSTHPWSRSARNSPGYSPARRQCQSKFWSMKAPPWAHSGGPHTPSYFYTRRGDGFPDGHIYMHTFSFPSSLMISRAEGPRAGSAGGPRGMGVGGPVVGLAGGPACTPAGVSAKTFWASGGRSRGRHRGGIVGPGLLEWRSPILLRLHS